MLRPTIVHLYPVQSVIRSRKTENIFEILLGASRLKWDPVRNLMRWLCQPGQGHGLDVGFQEKITHYAFGVIIPNMTVIEAFKADPSQPGTRKPAVLALAAPGANPPYEFLILLDYMDHTRPNAVGKINTLVYCAEKSRSLVEEGYLRVIVLTNSEDSSRFQKLRQALRPEFESTLGTFAWSLLPIATIGAWIESFLTQANPDSRYFLKSFVDWTRSLDT